MKLLFYLTIIFFSLGQLGRISFLGQQINFYLYEVAGFIFFLGLLRKYGLSPIRTLFNKFKIIFIFLAFLLISFTIGILRYNILENFVGILYFCRLSGYFIFFIYLQQHLNKVKNFNKDLNRSFLLFVFLTMTISIIQYFFYPNLRNLLYAGWDPHLDRIFGTYMDTSVAGGVYGLILLFLIANGRLLIKNKFWLFLLVGLMLTIIVLTYSRSLFLSLILPTLWLAIEKKLFRNWILFIVIFALLIMVSPKRFGEGVNLSRMFSVESRLVDYRNALTIWKKHVFFGVGYNRIRYEKLKLNIIDKENSEITHSGASFHSSFLIVLVTGGITGLILFILTLYRLALFSNIAKYYVGFLSLMSVADNILLQPFIFFLLIFLLVIPSRKLK